MIRSSVLTAHLENESVLLHLDSRRYYRLNETAQHIWHLLERGLSDAEIVRELTERFAVDSATARTALHELLQQLRTHDLVD